MSYVNQNYFNGDHFSKDVRIGIVAGMIALMVRQLLKIQCGCLILVQKKKKCNDNFN
jgi:hypothetical protein